MSAITRILNKTIKTICLSRVSIHISLRFEGSNVLQSNPNTNDSKMFSDEQKLLIVETINNCSETDFARYNIKKSQLKKLLEYKERYGQFNTFTDVLVIQEVPLLIKLCNSILSGGKSKKIPTKLNETVKNIIVPPIDKVTRENIKSVLGLHIWSNTISWALLKENNLTNWEQENYKNPTKSTLVPLINLISSITNQIPYADAYVMEADPYISPSKLKGAAFIFHVQRQQVIATIISILGMRRRLTKDNISNDIKGQIINKFFMMTPRSPAKRFNLTVGNEIMPAQTVVNDLFEGNVHKTIPNFPKITVDANLISNYKSSHNTNHENFHLALLTTLAFADFIYQEKFRDLTRSKITDFNNDS